MRICGLDLETTGLDIENDEIVELGYVIKDVGDPRPKHCGAFYVRATKPMPLEASEVNGIDDDTLDEFGIPLETALEALHRDLELYKVKYVVAHNGQGFDRPFLAKKAAAFEREWAFDRIPWIDTKTDLDYPKRFKSNSLIYLCAEHGFLNPFPHAALFDVMSMLRLLESYPIEKTLERAQSPWLTLRAVVSYDDRDKAKSMRYLWENSGEKVYPKCWVKRIRLCDLEHEQQQAKSLGVQIVKVG